MIRGSTDAKTCQLNGWTVGTTLEGHEGYGPERITITAIGRQNILAVGPSGRESPWSLKYRVWEAVE